MLLVGLTCVAAGPHEAAGFRQSTAAGGPEENSTARVGRNSTAACGFEEHTLVHGGGSLLWALLAKPELRCGASLLLHGATGLGLPLAASADCLSWVEHFGRAVLAGRWASAVGPLPEEPGTYPLAASLAWRSELLAVRGRVLLDAGADEVGEATTAIGGGKTTPLVLHSRNRRLDPFRGVRVGEAANPGP